VKQNSLRIPARSLSHSVWYY